MAIEQQIEHNLTIISGTTRDQRALQAVIAKARREFRLGNWKAARNLLEDGATSSIQLSSMNRELLKECLELLSSMRQQETISRVQTSNIEVEDDPIIRNALLQEKEVVEAFDRQNARWDKMAYGVARVVLGLMAVVFFCLGAYVNYQVLSDKEDALYHGAAGLFWLCGFLLAYVAIWGSKASVEKAIDSIFR